MCHVAGQYYDDKIYIHHKKHILTLSQLKQKKNVIFRKWENWNLNEYLSYARRLR